MLLIYSLLVQLFLILQFYFFCNITDKALHYKNLIVSIKNCVIIAFFDEFYKKTSFNINCYFLPGMTEFLHKQKTFEVTTMMYLHFCKICNRIHILNGHKMTCPKCASSLTELQMPYTEYIVMNPSQRQNFLDLCNNETSLHKISTTYRMYKYCKWYRNLQIINYNSCQNECNT